MAYNQFSLQRAVQDFSLILHEVNNFLPPVEKVAPSKLLLETLERNLPWAIAVDNEKARSEGIINPVLLELRNILPEQVSVFSGEEFNVDPQQELNGYCDFLVSRSPEQLFIQAPAIMVVEAKRGNLKGGLGQCAAELVAAQLFKQQNDQPNITVYGAVSNGTQWRFVKLAGQTLTINLLDHTLPPVDTVLGVLVWILKHG
ncbi:MAG: hypothetical protein RBJ76_00895 [Stenomitos frigidus ULC029]